MKRVISLRRVTPTLLALLLGLSVVAFASDFQTGDVFVAIGNGSVNEYTPSGTLVQTLNDGSGSTFTTGMAFDAGGNLYVTDFSTANISEFNVHGALVNANFISRNTPESMSMVNGAFPALVGGPTTGTITQYNSSGALMNTFNVQTENTGGPDWVDLQSDGKTVYYTSEGSTIFSFNIATNTQNAPFATGLPGGRAFALRTILSGTFAGDVLVADSSVAVLVGSGGILKTYTLPGNGGGDFALNLDPSGTAFWTADFATDTVWEVDIATGNILEQWTATGSVFGLAVFGEAGTTGQVPEPASLILMGSGLLGLAGAARRKFRS